MPLARYFLLVGGILLALLFVVDAFVPQFPVAEGENRKQPAIRIHSNLKWPERVVYDTSLPAIIPAQTTNAEINIPEPAVADVPARPRDAFAQLRPSDAIQLRASNPRKREVKLQRHRKPASKRAVPLELVMARRPHVGWFGYSIW